MKRYILLLTACLDTQQQMPDAAPPDAHVQTWGDASFVWSDAWCQLAARCNPVAFASQFGSQGRCQFEITRLNCQYAGNCEETYPADRSRWLDLCYLETIGLACGVTTTPSVCLAAFQ